MVRILTALENIVITLTDKDCSVFCGENERDKYNLAVLKDAHLVSFVIDTTFKHNIMELFTASKSVKLSGNKAVQFETKFDLPPTQAAKILGLSYETWKKLRTGEREIQHYHLASIEAHENLSEDKFKSLKEKRT